MGVADVAGVADTPALRALIDASPDLRLLLGLDPPPRPAPDALCALCKLGALPGHPLTAFLDGHVEHLWCPPPRVRSRLCKELKP